MVIYWPPGLLSKNNLMSDLSFPFKLDINVVYLTVNDKIKLDISSYFHTNDIRILKVFLPLVHLSLFVARSIFNLSETIILVYDSVQQKKV